MKTLEKFKISKNVKVLNSKQKEKINGSGNKNWAAVIVP